MGLGFRVSGGGLLKELIRKRKPCSFGVTSHSGFGQGRGYAMARRMKSDQTVLQTLRQSRFPFSHRRFSSPPPAKPASQCSRSTRPPRRATPSDDWLEMAPAQKGADGSQKGASISLHQVGELDPGSRFKYVLGRAQSKEVVTKL